MENDTFVSTQPDNDTCTISIDSHKVFQLPQLTHSDMYLSRKLGCYNFGIHLSDNGEGIIWLAPCVLHAVNDNHLTYKQNLRIWSDNCCGQIKNRIMLFLYIFSNCYRIGHEFIMVGHSFSASDRDSALIEKRGKVSRHQALEDVESVITNARPTKPFKVLKMRGHFLYFDEAASRTINTNRLHISKLVSLIIDSENPVVVKFKRSYSELEDFTTCNV
ncbi:hypothetical protein PR048_023883 [Dryococelus australis]|uniref:Uncharacterized protein n=1 Tax=Dryococelus australis TaxID=614101 RepID=A0ABQ9GVA8_9NEOP|nr:hypothetical protein PR048_023883 [Dryococelus australis]